MRDEMTAFEKQLTARLEHMAGPEPSVDAMASVRAATARSARWTFRSTFSATRFVVAAVVVALFGGFLIAGVMTTQTQDPAPIPGSAASPSPQATEDLLSRLETEEIAPGVLRVINDGVRDISCCHNGRIFDRFGSAGGSPAVESRVHVTENGRVWLFSAGGHFELGSALVHPWPGTEFMTSDDKLAVAPDGTAFKIVGWRPQSWEPMHKGEFWSHDGTEWTQESLTPPGVTEDFRARAVTVGSDGSVWTLTSSGVFIRDGTSWRQVSAEVPPSPRAGLFAVGADGTRWAMGSALRLYRDTGEGWETLKPTDEESDVEELGVSAYAATDSVAGINGDGVFWAFAPGGGPDLGLPLLVRRDDDGWRSFSRVEGLPKALGTGNLALGNPAFESLEVAADGRVWMNPAGTDAEPCGGLASFDGQTWGRYLEGLCVYDIAIGPDDRIWAVAGAPGVRDGQSTPTTAELYVVDPGRRP